MQKEITTFKALGSVFLGIFVLVICQSISSLIYLLPLSKTITDMIFATAYILLSYTLILFLCKKVLHYDISEFGIGKLKIKSLWLLIGIALPLIVAAILMMTPGYFVNNDKSTTEIISKVISSIFILGLGAGIVEEIIFRGFIMRVLEKRWGRKVAIIIPSIIFGLLHTIDGMNLLDIIMLFIAGTSVGIMFSLIAYESKSIWPSAIVHGIWNIIIIGGILDIGIKHNTDAIYSYVITSKSVLLTGGRFGIEASGIAIALYIIVIGLAIRKMRKKKDMFISI